MDAIIGLLGFGLIIWAVYGLFKPGSAMWWNESRSRGKVVLYFFGFFIALGAVGAAVTDKSTVDETSEPSTEQAQADESSSQPKTSPDPEPEPDPEPDPEPEPEPAPEPEPDLELVQHDASTDQYGNDIVVGIVRNNTDEEYSYVQVQVNVYDGDGTQLGSTMANANNLEPGGEWRFEAQVLEEGFRRYKITDVSGW